MAMGITGRLLFKLIIVIRMRFNMYNHVPEREAGTWIMGNLPKFWPQAGSELGFMALR